MCFRTFIPCATHRTPVDGQTLGRAPLPEGFYLDSLLLLGRSYRHMTWNTRQWVVISNPYRKQKKLLKSSKVKNINLNCLAYNTKNFLVCILSSIIPSPFLALHSNPSNNQRSSWLTIVPNHNFNRKNYLENFMSRTSEISLGASLFASRIVSKKYFSLWTIPPWTKYSYRPQTIAKPVFQSLISKQTLFVTENNIFMEKHSHLSKWSAPH